MSLLDSDEIARRTMTLFFIIDTSGSMAGQKINSVNSSINEVLPIIEDISKKNADAEIKVAFLQFASGISWVFNEPKNIEKISWVDLQAGGLTDMGAAFMELNDKLSQYKFLKSDTGAYAPVLLLLSDGAPTDDFENGLSKLKENKWYNHAIKAAIAIGNDCDKKFLEAFTGTNESIVEVHTVEQLKNLIRIVSVTASQIGSNSSVTDKSKQDLFNEELKSEILPADTDEDDDWD